MVPPITFSDVVAAREDVPILPSQLHPFLDADVVARFGKCTSTERERLFETPLLHALYARYLLVYWADVSSPWVSLAKVLEDAVQPDQVEQLDRYEVNLSKGVKTATNDRSCVNAVSYCEDHAQSYAVVWCRLKSRSSKPFVCAIHYTRQRLESPQRHDEGGVNLKLPVQQKSLSLDLIGSSIMINASQLHQN
ncbi:Bodo-specific multi-copy gene family, putative [Bodo saltans]|uniref:Bodo-specific multi-copy gene family, putative n=1 Tax=Bodo saltans TaxID=75058 RepID=A0A0S4JG16_BODSA|nr:Bodo-specific multi-copy gene family, putative [Bodo saltans]|eukprot:CUG89433.1 Bodo-specific multi-copy gene family, putative [Bodo saltans]